MVVWYREVIVGANYLCHVKEKEARSSWSVRIRDFDMTYAKGEFLLLSFVKKCFALT